MLNPLDERLEKLKSFAEGKDTSVQREEVGDLLQNGLITLVTMREHLDLRKKNEEGNDILSEYSRRVSSRVKGPTCSPC